MTHYNFSSDTDGNARASTEELDDCRERHGAHSATASARGPCSDQSTWAQDTLYNDNQQAHAADWHPECSCRCEACAGWVVYNREVRQVQATATCSSKSDSKLDERHSRRTNAPHTTPPTPAPAPTPCPAYVGMLLAVGVRPFRHANRSVCFHKTK